MSVQSGGDASAAVVTMADMVVEVLLRSGWERPKLPGILMPVVRAGMGMAQEEEQDVDGVGPRRAVDVSAVGV